MHIILCCVWTELEGVSLKQLPMERAAVTAAWPVMNAYHMELPSDLMKTPMRLV